MVQARNGRVGDNCDWRDPSFVFRRKEGAALVRKQCPAAREHGVRARGRERERERERERDGWMGWAAASDDGSLFSFK